MGGYPAGLGGVKKGIKSSSYQKHLINAQEIMRKTNPVLTDKLYWQENEETDLSWLGQDDFVYLDPPYINAKVLAYKNNTLSHRKMAEDLKNAKFKWLLSEYDNQLYRDIIGPPFATKDVQLSVGFETTLLSQRRIECVWKNY